MPFPLSVSIYVTQSGLKLIGLLHAGITDVNYHTADNIFRHAQSEAIIFYELFP